MQRLLWYYLKEDSMSSSLKGKALSGMVWTSFNHFAQMGITFVSDIILARLLMPEDYGVIGMLTIFIMVSKTFLDGGFASALIQKKMPTQTDYSTVFFWNLGLSIILYLILFFAAPFIADFYNMPILAKVLRVQALILILSAFTIVQYSQLKKQFKFKKLAIIQMFSSVTALIITVVCAYIGMGVWALVIHYLLISLIPSVCYWLTNRWYPSLVFSTKSFNELFSFGVYMMLTQFFNTLCQNIQGLLIGRMYSASTMGYYSKAKTAEGVASTAISVSLMQVTYPLYSECQDDRVRLINVIKKIATSIAYITFPMMFLLILVAKPLIILLYSERWSDSVPYFQLLCLMGLATCLQGVNSQAIAAVGRSKQMFVWTVTKRCIGLGLIVGGLYFGGIYGLIVGVILSEWISYIINALLVSKYVGYKLKVQVFDLLPIVAITVGSFLSTYFISSLWDSNMYIDALMKMPLFSIIYLSLSFTLKIKAFENVRQIVPLFLNKILKRR